MGAMDGVTMAKRLRQDNDTVQIVFITGYSDYISEGYEVAALHYLMKPIKEDKLFSVLDRAVEKLFRNEKVLNFEIGSEMIRVPIYQIRYAEVMGNYVTVHASTDITVKMTLGELEKELDDRFFRVSRSVVVNLTQIGRVTKAEIKLNDGTVIPIPRGAYDAAEDWEAIKRYLDLLDEGLTTVDTVIKTGNPMTDAILNSKISLARAKGIQVVVDAQIPVKLKFTAGKKLQKDGKRFRSTKGDGHVFGLMRIDAIVERLEGYITAIARTVHLQRKSCCPRCENLQFITGI